MIGFKRSGNFAAIARRVNVVNKLPTGRRRQYYRREDPSFARKRLDYELVRGAGLGPLPLQANFAQLVAGSGVPSHDSWNECSARLRFESMKRCQRLSVAAEMRSNSR